MCSREIYELLYRKWRSSGAAGAVIGRLRFLGNGHLSSTYFVHRDCQADNVNESSKKMTFADRYLHVYIETSENRSIGGEGRDGMEGSSRQARGKSISLSTIFVPRGKGGCMRLRFFFLFFLAGVATPASANRKQFRELVHQCCHLFCFLGGGN